MSKYTLLTIDLKNLGADKDDKRGTFNEEMKKVNWEKISNLTTAWKAKWEDHMTDSQIISETKSDIVAAARKAKISSYTAALSVGYTKVEVW